jgi:hypothetical protein
MVGSSVARSRRGQHQQTGELGGDEPQIFEDRLAGDDVRNSGVIEGKGHRAEGKE